MLQTKAQEAMYRVLAILQLECPGTVQLTIHQAITLPITTLVMEWAQLQSIQQEWLNRALVIAHLSRLVTIQQATHLLAIKQALVPHTPQPLLTTTAILVLHTLPLPLLMVHHPSDMLQALRQGTL